jgi:hypothetical protein
MLIAMHLRGFDGVCGENESVHKNIISDFDSLVHGIF